MNTASRQLAAMSQLAKIKATSRNTWYRLATNTGNRTYRLEVYDRNVTPGVWNVDPGNDWVTLPPGIQFLSGLGIATPPPGHSGTPATEMAFNTRGLLVNWSAGPPPTAAPLNSRCIYLVRMGVEGAGVRPTAVCASLAGKTSVYRLATGSSGAWEIQ